MTENNFKLYYTKKTKEGMPLEAYVLVLAYQIIPDFEAAREIRDEVMAIGLKRCTEFEVKTAWGGSASWQGLKKITRTCCERMMLRPMQENPLAKETLKQCGDPWTAAIGKLSFRHRQIFLLQMAFGGNTRVIHELLNKHRAENEKKLTEKEVKNLQAEAAALMVAHLPAPYTVSD